MMPVSTLALTDLSCLRVNKHEVMRYLGIKEMDAITEELYEECVKQAFSLAEPRAVYTSVNVNVKEDIVDLGFSKVNSKNLSKNLCGCSCAYIFAATIGIGLDRAFERMYRVSQAKATVFSAVASSLVESFCDYVNGKLVKGSESAPRFSAGYGDFSIEHQGEILNILEANKRLGICLTDSYMMVPVKSVTAIIGIRR